MPNTKKQYAGGKRPGKTKRFFKALATGSTKTKVSVQDTEHKTKKLHASEQKLKEIESQVKRTKSAAKTHATTKKKLETIDTEIKRLESIDIRGGLKSSNRYYNLKRERTKLRQEFKNSKAAYYEHAKLKLLMGRAEIKVNKRKKTLKAYEQAAKKLTLQKFNKKRWVTGWDKKYKKASIADIHKFINVDSKLDTFKTISDSEGKPVKKLLKQFELNDFMKHPARATEVIDSFPGVKEYSAKIGINIDKLHENQKALLAHKIIEITKNPDITERAMATEMVKSVVVTKFASPEIKLDSMGYVKAPDGMGNPAPRLYNPGESSTVKGPFADNRLQFVEGPNRKYNLVNRSTGNTEKYNTISAPNEPAYLEPRPVPDPFKGYELVPEEAKNQYGKVEYNTIRQPTTPEYLEPRPVPDPSKEQVTGNAKNSGGNEPTATLRRKTNPITYSTTTIKEINSKPQKESGVRKTTEELRSAYDYIKGLPDDSPEKAKLVEAYNEKLNGFSKTFESFTSSAPIIGGVEPIPTLPANIQIYNTASAGPASQETIYNNPANLLELANKSARANPERTGTIKLKAGPNTPNTEGIYANMNTTAGPTYNNPE